MKLFDIVPRNHFRLLSYSNQDLYAKAVEVLYDLFKRSRIYIDRDELVARLSTELQDLVYKMEKEDDEDLEEEFSGRIHFVIRRLEEFGWLEKDDAFNAKKLVIPGYALKIMSAIYDVVSFQHHHYNSLVFGTYSALEMADTKKQDYYNALFTAHRNTMELQDNLKSLIMNMKQYHKMLLRETETHKILEQHFESYAETIDVGQLHPLKTIDSIPRFKDKIIRIIEKWEINERICNILATDKQKSDSINDEQAKCDIMTMMNDIIDIYQGINEIMKVIDTKHKDYVRASQERITTLLHAEKSVKGLLASILNMLPKMRSANFRDEEVEAIIGEDLPLFSLEILAEESLHTEGVRKERGKEQPVRRNSIATQENALQQVRELLEQMNYERQIVNSNAFIATLLAGKSAINASEVTIRTRDEFLKLLYAIVNESAPDSIYSFTFFERMTSIGNARTYDFLLALRSVVSEKRDKEVEVT